MYTRIINNKERACTRNKAKMRVLGSCSHKKKAVILQRRMAGLENKILYLEKNWMNAKSIYILCIYIVDVQFLPF